MGNPKIFLQVLWECGFIYTSKNVCTYYTLHQQEDLYRNTILGMVLRELMLKLINLIGEETLLQTNAFKMEEFIDHINTNETPQVPPWDFWWGHWEFMGVCK